MEPIRCAIANMPKEVLADILEQLTRASSEFEVVKRLASVKDLGEFFNNNEEANIELAVVGMKSTEFNQSFFNSFDGKHDISVIAIIDEGKHMAAFLNNFGQIDFLQAMRLLSRSKINEDDFLCENLCLIERFFFIEVKQPHHKPWSSQLSMKEFQTAVSHSFLTALFE